MMNNVSIMGRLCYDPELKRTNSGKAVCGFRIACDRNSKTDSGEKMADFISVQAWERKAEFVAKNFSNGGMIAVEGALRSSRYTDKNGNNRTDVYVLAREVSFCGANGANGAKKEPKQGGNWMPADEDMIEGGATPWDA